MRALSAALSLLVVVGCAGGDGPATPTNDLEVTPGAPVLTHVDDSVALTATKDGRPVGGLTLRLVNETREVASLPVLRADALGRGVLRPGGPGRAILDVASPSGTTRITVRVEVTGPAVFAVGPLPPGASPDTVTLLGVGLGAVPLQGALRIGGVEVGLTHRDANTLRFPAVEVGVERCEGPAARTAGVALAGAQVPADLAVPVRREGEIRLRTGEFTFLSDRETKCLRLPVTRGEYVLAWVDLRQEVQGRGGWAGWPTDPYAVRIVDRTGAGAQGTGAPAPATPRTAGAPREPMGSDPGHLRLEAAGAEGECSDTDFSRPTFWCRSKPWVVGDRMTIREPGSWPAVFVTATVAKVYGNGRFPLAVVDGDDSDALARFRQGIDSAMPHVTGVSVPLFEAVFGTSTPNTSEASGQLLTIIGDFQHSSVGAGCCEGGAPWAVVTLGAWHAPWTSEVFYLFTHEFAHAWQMRWFFDHRPEGGDTWPTALWAVEGGADLLAYEAQRRYAGVPWRANRPLSSFDDGGKPDGPLFREALARGEFGSGYADASSFFRDVVARLVASGTPLDEAYRELTLGSLEEWHGWDTRGTRRIGLTERVRARMPTWEIGDAMLLYTLSQGADDMTTVAALQNPFYRAVGSDPQFAGAGFPRLLLTTGSGQQLLHPGPPTSLGYVRIEDGGAGGSIEISADRPHLRWAIARVR